MSDIIRLGTDSSDTKLLKEYEGIIEFTEKIILDTKEYDTAKQHLSIPIAQLSSLGAGVSSLIPALNTITQTTSIPSEGLFRLANASIGDSLKQVKNGNYWGAFKTAEGKSKFAQLQSVESITSTTKTVAPLNPATMMMAVALFSIDQKLGDIEKIQKEILSFLEIEKESEIEADVETLSTIITKYKHNWDNQHFVSSNHKLVLDIQRTARKNMIGYQKKVGDLLRARKYLVIQSKVNETLKDLQKNFKYYRLSLYTFSLASMLEVMLSGNYSKENISSITEELEKLSTNYRGLFNDGSEYLENISGHALESNVLKGIGSASQSVGKIIGNVPLLKKRNVDEFLQKNGENIKSGALNIEKSAILAFTEIGNPETRVIIDRLGVMNRIYNHTDEICFDDKNIYLLSS